MNKQNEFKVGDWVYGSDWCYGEIEHIEEGFALVSYTTSNGGGSCTFYISELKHAPNPITQCLQRTFGMTVNHEYDNWYGRNDYILACVIPPHEGNQHRYVVRFSTVAAFDRWSNSRAIEKLFDTMEEVIDYIEHNKLEIYEQLLQYLSSEYEDLREDFEREFFDE